MAANPNRIPTGLPQALGLVAFVYGAYLTYALAVATPPTATLLGLPVADHLVNWTVGPPLLVLA